MINLYELSSEELVTLAYLLSLELTKGLTSNQQNILAAFLNAISDNVAVIATANIGPINTDTNEEDFKK